jgi:hypothetical protein
MMKTWFSILFSLVILSTQAQSIIIGEVPRQAVVDVVSSKDNINELLLTPIQEQISEIKAQKSERLNNYYDDCLRKAQCGLITAACQKRMEDSLQKLQVVYMQICTDLDSLYRIVVLEVTNYRLAVSNKTVAAHCENLGVNIIEYTDSYINMFTDQLCPRKDITKELVACLQTHVEPIPADHLDYLLERYYDMIGQLFK